MEEHKNLEITNRKLTSIENQISSENMLTRKKTISRVNNFTNLSLDILQKKEEIRLLTEEENRVADFLKQKLKRSTIKEKMLFTNIGSLENAEVDLESNISELSNDEKEYIPPTSTIKKRATSIHQSENKNRIHNIKSNPNRISLSSQNLIHDDGKCLFRPSMKSHKTIAIQERGNKLGELNDTENGVNEPFTEKISRKSSYLVKSTIKTKKFSEDYKNISPLRTKKYSVDSLPIIYNSKQIRTSSNKLFSSQENGFIEITEQNFKSSNISELGQIEKNILYSEKPIKRINSDFKKSEKKIELGDSEESINLEEGNIENAKEIKEELKSNLRLNMVQLEHDSTLRSEYEDLGKQKEKKYRTLSHKNLIYDSLSEEDSETNIINIIHPDSNFLIYLHFLLCLAGFYSIIFTPIYIAFFYASPSNFLNYFFIMENFIEILFIFDVIINLFTGFYDREEKLIISKNRIAKNYLKTWMILDVLSALPTHTILFTINILNYKNENHIARINLLKTYDYPYIWILLLLRLTKLLKIIKANKFTDCIVKNLFEELNATLYRVLQFILYFSLMTHCLACIFIFVGTLSHPNWMLDQHLLDTTSSDIYLASIYYIMTTLFTIGYGDIKSISLNERLYNILILLFGVLIYSYAVSSLGNFFLEKSVKEKLLEANMQCLERINHKYPLKHKLNKKIVKYLKFKSKTNKNEETAFLNELPTSLKNEMILRIYNPIIKDFVFFRNVVNASKDFTVRVVMSLKPVTALRNDRLINEGEYMEEMIFIKNGILSLEVGIKVILKKYLKQFLKLPEKDMTKTDLSKDISSSHRKNRFEDFSDNFNKPEKNNKFYKTLYLKLIQLRNNEHFGDILMFLNKRSPLSVRVKSKTAQLFTMNKTDMVSISMSYPQIFEKICEKGAFNQKQLEVLITKTKYLFYKNNKNQFIGYDFKIREDDEEKFSHYYLNTFDEEEMKKFLNCNLSLKSIPSTRKIEDESIKSDEENKVNIKKTKQATMNNVNNKQVLNKCGAGKKSSKSLRNSSKILPLPVKNGDTNYDNSYKQFYDQLNNRIEMNKSNDNSCKLDTLTDKNMNNQVKMKQIDSQNSNSSNLTISEKSSSEEDESNEVILGNSSLQLNNNMLVTKPTFGIQEKSSQRSEETFQFKSNFNQQKFNEGDFKNFSNDKLLEYLQFKNDNILLTDYTNNKFKYNKTISSEVINYYNQLQTFVNEVSNRNDTERKNTIFSEFQRIKENNLDHAINQELSSNQSREKDKIKNIEIKQMLPFYSKNFPEEKQNNANIPNINIFGNIGNNGIQNFGHDFRQIFPGLFLTDESKKNSHSENSTDKNSNQLENKILCNININNNINFSENVFMQTFHSNCPMCNSTIFPISSNRVLLVYPSEKCSQLKEIISWTNLKVSNSNSFEINPKKTFISITTIQKTNTNYHPISQLLKSSSMNILKPSSSGKLNEDNGNIKFPKSRPESTNSLNPSNKLETPLSPLLLKNSLSIINRKNSIDLLHQFKNTLFDQGKLKQSDKQPDTSGDAQKVLTNTNDNPHNLSNNNGRITDKKYPTKNILSVVYKNIQENSMNLNEPKSFYSNLLMEVLDEKHKNLYMMKSLVERLKGIRELIITNSSTKSVNFNPNKDIG